MTPFTPLPALAGGILIGLAAVLMWALLGRIAGISGIAGGLWFSAAADRLWRALFLIGLVLGAGAWYALGAPLPTARAGFPVWALIAAGVLVGYGTSLAGGCTSGHGVCGLARFSRRSLAATAVFLALAIVTTFVARHLLHIA